MNIYIAHSTNYDFTNELYEPIKKSEIFKSNQIILPYSNTEWVNSKETIKNSDLIIAEVSYPSIGLGIELGWADAFNIPIVCICKEEVLSRSLQAVCKKTLKYSEDSLQEALKEAVQNR